jgi:hypothetical protein
MSGVVIGRFLLELRKTCQLNSHSLTRSAAKSRRYQKSFRRPLAPLLFALRAKTALPMCTTLGFSLELWRPSLLEFPGPRGSFFLALSSNAAPSDGLGGICLLRLLKLFALGSLFGGL